MKDRAASRRTAHIIIRSACLLTAGNYTLALIYKPYFNLVGYGLTGRLLTEWDMISTIFIPAVVLLLALIERGDKRQRKAIWIDAIVAVLWFVYFWGSVYYAFSHYVFT